MSIPKWRYVTYKDDGVVEYECLSCYGRWGSDGSPGYTLDGVYHESWKFCPICGLRWQGSVNEFGRESAEKEELKEKISRREYNKGPRIPKSVWLLESREFYRSGAISQWRLLLALSCGIAPVSEVYRILNRQKSILDDDNDSNVERNEVRGRIISGEDFKLKYGTGMIRDYLFDKTKRYDMIAV